jgi:hypothetical protein
MKWVDVFKRREEDGLGVKCIEKINVALLCKWKWRILNGKSFTCLGF